jgi:hypothetical protein
LSKKIALLDKVCFECFYFLSGMVSQPINIVPLSNNHPHLHPSSLLSLLQKAVLSISKEAKMKWGWKYPLEKIGLQPKLLSKEERKTETCKGTKGLRYGNNTKENGHTLFHLWGSVSAAVDPKLKFLVILSKAVHVHSLGRHQFYLFSMHDVI